MFNEDNIMKVENTLPENFDGTFYFTNYSDEDFVGQWGKKQYRYPARTTSKMVIPEHSPLEIQQIRKKFAKDLAEREFYRGERYESLRRIEGERDPFTGMVRPTLNSSLHANSYNLEDLTPFIQRALEPLEMGQATVSKAEGIRLEAKISRDEDNQLNSAAIGSDKDLENLAKGTLEQKVLGNAATE